MHTAAFFGPNFGANSVKKIGLTLSQSRLHTARRNFMRIIIFRIRVNLFRFSQLSPLSPLLSLSPSLSSVSPWPADFGFPKRNKITAICKDLKCFGHTSFPPDSEHYAVCVCRSVQPCVGGGWRNPGNNHRNNRCRNALEKSSASALKKRAT